jgi:hypothetical protein
MSNNNVNIIRNDSNSSIDALNNNHNIDGVNKNEGDIDVIDTIKANSNSNNTAINNIDTSHQLLVNLYLRDTIGGLSKEMIEREENIQIVADMIFDEGITINFLNLSH